MEKKSSLSSSMNNSRIILIGIILVGFLLRLYRFDNPIADWHSWRQADTASVSRELLKNNFDLLHPRYHDLSNIPSGFDNPVGYRFVEFPIYNFVQAFSYKFTGILSLEQWGRMISIISSLISIIFLYLIVKNNIGKKEAMFSSLFFAFLPFSIYFSRTILPDEMMVTAILGGIYFFDQMLKKNIQFQISNFQFQIRLNRIQISNIQYPLFALLFSASALLLKPYALFFTLPMIYLAWRKFGFSFLVKWQLWVFLALSVLPLILWRKWMIQFPEGIPVSSWLFNDSGIRFKPAFFYWIFGDRISRLILGYFGVSLLFCGLLKLKDKIDNLFPLSLLISSILYLFVIAGGNVRHDYYQILIIPTICIFLAMGTVYIINKSKRAISIFLPLFIITGMFIYSGYYIKDYFNINNWGIVFAGREADKILPVNTKVIALYEGDTSFLYQTNRKGWPAFEKPINEMKDLGAEYIIIASPTVNDFNGFGKMYKIVSSSKDYLILKL